MPGHEMGRLVGPDDLSPDNDRQCALLPAGHKCRALRINGRLCSHFNFKSADAISPIHGRLI